MYSFADILMTQIYSGMVYTWFTSESKKVGITS